MPPERGFITSEAIEWACWQLRRSDVRPRKVVERICVVLRRWRAIRAVISFGCDRLFRFGCNHTPVEMIDDPLPLVNKSLIMYDVNTSRSSGARFIQQSKGANLLT